MQLPRTIGAGGARHVPSTPGRTLDYALPVGIVHELCAAATLRTRQTYAKLAAYNPEKLKTTYRPFRFLNTQRDEQLTLLLGYSGDGEKIDHVGLHAPASA